MRQLQLPKPGDLEFTDVGPMIYRDVAAYKTPHPAELPLVLQDHNNPVRYRNIWIRRPGGYDLFTSGS